MWTVVVILLALSGPGLSLAREVCETRVCIDRAKQFLDSMDPSADPCNDFYQFSCGQYVEENNVDQEESVASVFSELEADMQRNLRKSLVRINVTDDSLPEFVRQMRSLYDKCLDTTQIESDGMTSLTTLLTFIDGDSFFNRSNFKGEEFSLERRTRLMTNAGIVSDFLIDLDFIPNLKNTSELIINFSHSNDIDDQSLIKQLEEEVVAEELDEDSIKEIQRYATFIFSISRGLHANITKDEVTEIIMLNRRLLIAAMEIMELKKNVTNLVNVMTVEEMQDRYPALNWTDYIRAKTFGQIKAEDYDGIVVNVMELGYFQTINEILTETDPLIISLYQTLKIIMDHMDRVNKSFRNLKFRMSNPGVQAKSQPRWKTCVSDIVEEFGMGISYVYVKDYGSEDLKNFSVDIITRLKEQFERMMAKSQWFDEVTFGKAKEKLEAVMNQIAYSEELLNVTFVESHYQGLNFTHLSYFDSILQLRKLGHIRNVENYLDPTEFSNQLQFVEVTMVNGFYVPFSNSIQIPMGILQSKFIDLEGPLYLNYGSLGFTMAHELSHAFDDFGRQFDLKGNVANWYSEKATELNAEKEQCIIDQYNAFTEKKTELKINGQNTLSENMADLGGVLISYYAYKSAPARQGHDLLPLPGLNYTMDQQFWLAFGTTWCSAYRTSKLKNIIEYDMHAPAQFRINGALQNVGEFARDFNCDVGTPMNPEKKCTVF